MTPPNYPKRLIEVDLPIKRICAHARREKSIRHGHISTLHIWWARRPLAACRAVICAALWPDPARTLALLNSGRMPKPSWPASGNPFGRTDQDFDDPMALRSALLDFIADFANWDNSTVTNTWRPAARSPKRRTRRWAARRARGRWSLIRLPAAARFRSKPCAWARTPLPATSIPCRCCSTRSSSNTSPNTASAWPMKSANGASGSSRKPRRNWPSSIPKTRTARRPSPISGRGRFNAKAPAAARKCRSSAPCGWPRRAITPWP